jgi:hypothetical protein
MLKLLCSENLPRASKPNEALDRISIFDIPNILTRSDYQHLALLGTRILLDFGAFREANDVQTTLVHSYMRVVYAVPQHREYGYTGYTSEPIIAEAAARAMAMIQERAGEDGIARILRPYVTSGLVQKGERGELVARLLMILAIDKAHALTGSKNYSTAVPLGAFMKALLGRDAWENNIRQSVPDNTAAFEGNSFSAVFNDAKVRFTHFGRAGGHVSSAMAYAAFLRGMAIQCQPNQQSIDLVIPVFFGTTETKVKEQNITAILISIKNRSKPTSIALVAINAENLYFFPQTPVEKPHPYIALVMELGISEAMIKTTHASPNLHHSEPRPRYSIYVHGCSPQAYAVIENEHVYTNLLTSVELLDDFPSLEPKYVDALYGMKPDWRPGVQYKWLKHPSLNQAEGSASRD